MFYKNISNATKTFYGITFKPGDIKDVPGYINDAWFERCDKPKSSSKPAEQKSESKPELKSAGSKPASSSNKSTKNEDKEDTVDGKDSNQ